MEVAVPTDIDDVVLPNCPREVRSRAADPPREPCADPTAGISVEPASGPKHRLAVIGDSLAHGFESGPIINTDISFPAIIAYELGCLDRFPYPRDGGPGGGLPFNIKYLLRDHDSPFGSETSTAEVPFAFLRNRHFVDDPEDCGERGLGSLVPALAGHMRNLGIHGWKRLLGHRHAGG
jgi:hypothetical protein